MAFWGHWKRALEPTSAFEACLRRYCTRPQIRRDASKSPGFQSCRMHLASTRRSQILSNPGLRNLSTKSTTTSTDQNEQFRRVLQRFHKSRGEDKVPCTEISKDQLQNLTSKELTRTEIASHFGLQVRDLRDIGLAKESMPRLLVRPSSILVILFDLCLIIQSDRVLLVNADGESSYTEKLLMHALEDKLFLTNPKDVPFELRVLEISLMAVTSWIEEDFSISSTTIKSDLLGLDTDDNNVQTKLITLAEHARNLATVEQRAYMIQKTFDDLLNEDEDLAAMYLTDASNGNPHVVSDHQEVEYLLETYFERASGIARSATALKNTIRQTEETINAVLDAKRNHIMLFEAKTAVIAVGFAAGTFIAGLFGMNLVNGIEEASWGFPVISGVSVVLIGVYIVWLGRSLKRVQTFRPRVGRGGG